MLVFSYVLKFYLSLIIFSTVCYSTSLCFSLFLSLSLCLSVFLSLCLSVSLSFSVSLCVSLLFLYLGYRSIPSIGLCLFVFLSLSRCLAVGVHGYISLMLTSSILPIVMYTTYAKRFVDRRLVLIYVFMWRYFTFRDH